jgi:molybdopterin synthase catalytic subunit
MVDLKIINEPLDVMSCINWIMSPKAGGINIFLGTVREETKGRKVIRLEFEAYEKMALSEMQKIVDEIMNRWQLHKILIHHRVGALQIGEIPVIICISASHRDAAFEACRYAIDTLKQTVPIWKKEIFEDGEQWVAAHP